MAEKLGLKVDNQDNILNTIIEVPVLDDLEVKTSSKLSKDGRVYATGRRKTSSARLWLSIGQGFEVNKKDIGNYFSEAEIFKILSPLHFIESLKEELAIKVYSTVKGGGKSSQASALRLALARALSLFDANFRSSLKQEKFLTCDARRKEREHYGFRTSRKPQQYKRR